MIQSKKDIGIIGAGKVGTSLGAYFLKRSVAVTGFYDAVTDNALDAAKRTTTRCYGSLGEVLAANEVLFITVPDDRIASVWEQCRAYPIAGRCFFHCSGALSSEVFAGNAETGVFVGSAHPVCAVSSRASADIFSGKFFVMEGDATGIELLKSLMMQTRNPYHVIGRDEKVKYHAAAVASSNLFCALAQMSEDWLMACGFDSTSAHEMLTPLMQGNVDNIVARGCLEALTGPVERGDIGTVARHLDTLEGNDREIYRLLSLRLVAMAQQKHPERMYTNLFNLLEK